MEVKRNNWVSEISSILEKKRSIDEKVDDKEWKSMIAGEIASKKEEKMNEISEFYDKVRVAVNKSE